MRYRDKCVSPQLRFAVLRVALRNRGLEASEINAPSPVDGTPRCSQVDRHRRLTQMQMCVPTPTHRTMDRSGHTTTPGQPGRHVRTDLPTPSTGRHGAARSIDPMTWRMWR
jgi:hypothetical protein